MLTIDGAQGEGGGQILRTALALSAVTGTPFRIERIRARRQRPGLLRQHLTAVEAAGAVCGADVEGAAPGATRLTFRPGRVRPGAYEFAVGTAGSTGLVLQTLLPPLMLADRSSTVRLHGGTHNPLAPPYDFLARAFLPLLGQMGPGVEAALERPGFYPTGGGAVRVEVTPVERLAPLALGARGAVVRRRARALLARLPRHIADRELRVVQSRLGWRDEELETLVLGGGPDAPRGGGNVLLLEIESEHVTEVFTGFGAVGVPAETVAERAVGEVERYLAAGAPVGPHLADQLLIPCALAGGGSFRTMPLTPHATTSIAVITDFLGPALASATDAGGTVTVTACRPAGFPWPGRAAP